MKHSILFGAAALALAACGDTSETELDNAYEGGGDEAVEMIEGAPVPVVPEEASEAVVEAAPEMPTDLDATINEATAAPAAEVMDAEDSDPANPVEEILVDTETLIDAEIPNSADIVEETELNPETVELPSTEELTETVEEIIVEPAEDAIDAVSEEAPETETPQ